jgi:hypothetical protein
MIEPLLQRGHSYSDGSRAPGRENPDQLIRAVAACSALLAVLLRMSSRQRGPMAGAVGATSGPGAPAGPGGALTGYRQTRDLARDLTGDVAAIGAAMGFILSRRRAAAGASDPEAARNPATRRNAE